MADGKASSVTVVGIAGIQNGDMMLSLSDGTTRPATEVAFAEKGTKDLYDMAKVYGNVQTANTFLKTYDLVGGDTEAFQKAFYRYYEAGLTVTKPEKPGVNVKAAVLSPEVQKMALDAGKKAGQGVYQQIQILLWYRKMKRSTALNLKTERMLNRNILSGKNY